MVPNELELYRKMRQTVKEEIEILSKTFTDQLKLWDHKIVKIRYPTVIFKILI